MALTSHVTFIFNGHRRLNLTFTPPFPLEPNVKGWAAVPLQTYSLLWIIFLSSSYDWYNLELNYNVNLNTNYKLWNWKTFCSHQLFRWAKMQMNSNCIQINKSDYYLHFIHDFALGSLDIFRHSGAQWQQRRKFACYKKMFLNAFSTAARCIDAPVSQFHCWASGAKQFQNSSKV